MPSVAKVMNNNEGSYTLQSVMGRFLGRDSPITARNSQERTKQSCSLIFFLRNNCRTLQQSLVLTTTLELGIMENNLVVGFPDSLDTQPTMSVKNCQPLQQFYNLIGIGMYNRSKIQEQDTPPTETQRQLREKAS